MNIIGLVLQFTVQKGLRSEIRHRDLFPAQNRSGAGRPVADQFFTLCVDRTGNQVKDELPLCHDRPQPLQASQQDQRIPHILAHEGLASLHLLPGFQKQLQLVVGLQHLARKSDAGGPDIPYLLAELLLNNALVSEHQNLSEFVQAVTAGTPADLVHFGRCQRTELPPVKLLRLGEDDALDGQGDTEPDGIRCDDQIGLSPGVFPDLVSPRLRRQRAVDDTRPEPVSLEQGGRGKHALAGKDDQRIVRPQVLISAADPSVAQRGQSLVPHHAVPVRKLPDQAFDVMQCLRRHADMHDLGVHQADGLQPRGPAPRVGDQLGLVDHCGLEVSSGVAELDRRRDDLCVFDRDGLLPRQHAAGDAGGVDLVEHLQCQQAQRPQIGSRGVRLQVFDGVIGLSAVGRSHVQHKAALQLFASLDIRVRGVFSEDFADLRDFPFLFPASPPLFLQLGQFRVRQCFSDLLLRPDGYLPPGAALCPDGSQLRLRKVFPDLIFGQSVLPRDLLFIEQLFSVFVASVFCHWSVVFQGSFSTTRILPWPVGLTYSLPTSPPSVPVI